MKEKREPVRSECHAAGIVKESVVETLRHPRKAYEFAAWESTPNGERRRIGIKVVIFIGANRVKRGKARQSKVRKQCENGSSLTIWTVLDDRWRHSGALGILVEMSTVAKS